MLRTILALGIREAADAKEAYGRAGRALAVLELIGQSEDAQGKAILVEDAAVTIALVIKAHPVKPPVPPELLKQSQQLLVQFAALARPLLDKGDLSPLGCRLLAEGEIAAGHVAEGLAVLNQGLAGVPALAGSSRDSNLALLHMRAAQLLIDRGQFPEAQPHWTGPGTRQRRSCRARPRSSGWASPDRCRWI